MVDVALLIAVIITSLFMIQKEVIICQEALSFLSNATDDGTYPSIVSIVILWVAELFALTDKPDMLYSQIINLLLI